MAAGGGAVAGGQAIAGVKGEECHKPITDLLTKVQLQLSGLEWAGRGTLGRMFP